CQPARPGRSTPNAPNSRRLPSRALRAHAAALPPSTEVHKRALLLGRQNRKTPMTSRVETLTPPNTPTPIGPYSHVAKVGQHITIGGTAGVDPATGQLAGQDVGSQTRQILKSFEIMLEAVGSDLNHVVHVNVFLQNMSDFDAMNTAYIEVMGN